MNTQFHATVRAVIIIEMRDTRNLWTKHAARPARHPQLKWYRQMKLCGYVVCSLGSAARLSLMIVLVGCLYSCRLKMTSLLGQSLGTIK